tara:strand:+ start:43 stop:288 length:246 start_codon:yes stop_codon:yes gene_type:complete
MEEEEFLLILDYENMSIKDLNEAYTIIGSRSSSLCDGDIKGIIRQYRKLSKREFNYKTIEMKINNPPKIMKKAPRRNKNLN